jgi:hypothetical protein
VHWPSGDATVAVQRPVQDGDGAGDGKRAGVGGDRWLQHNQQFRPWPRAGYRQAANPVFPAVRV